MLERHNGLEPDPEGAFTYYDLAQATIADLQGQLEAAKKKVELATAKAPRVYDCGSCAIGKGFEQRVTQLEGENEKLKTRRKEWGEAEYIKLREFFDAALRRAKAEGMEAAAKFVDDDCYIPGGQLLPDYEHRCKHNVNQKELAAKIRARAAQIEEGE